MRYFFYILSFTTMLSSTQPIWDMACQTLVGSCGTASLCEGSTCSVPLDEEDCPDNPNRQCCPSFQCCFLAFAGFSTPYTLDFREITLQKNRPSERADVLRSSFTSSCFHPPDAAFFFV
ncbi:MAG: hypothetical protein R2825_06275 [Saprospiraceae bacterium]